jgi:septal ring factor EnvC (AmiA/AmiB activator)
MRMLVIPAAVLLLAAGGCIVTKSSYDMKASEADGLRSALAVLNREKARLAGENAELSKRVASCGEKEAALSGRIGEMDDFLRRLGEELEASRTYDRRRMTREQFLEDLIAGEKAASERMRALAARAEACEEKLGRMASGNR